MNILISCIGRRGYLADFFRDASAKPCRILGTGNTIWTPGFRRCDQAFLLPDIGDPDYVDRLVSVCVNESVDMFLSVSDPDTHRLAPFRGRFEEAGITTFLVSPEVSKVCFDKLSTAEFLSNNGFASPKTYSNIESATAALEDNEIKFPVFVKPRFGSASQDLFRARNAEEMNVFFRYAPDMIIQESLLGEEHSLDVFNDLKGLPISVIVKHKLAMRGGETDQSVTIKDEALLDWGRSLGMALGHVGPLDVDFFLVGDQPYLLELNPRFGGGYPSSHLAGASFPELMLRIANSENVPERIGEYKAGVRMIKEINGVEFAENAEREFVDYRNLKA